MPLTVPSFSSLVQSDGFSIALLSGAPYERGFQHGQLLAERIRLMRDTLYRDLIFRSGRAVGYGFLALSRGLLAIMSRHIPSELRDEMRGVADGSGVAYQDILFFNCFDDLLHSLVRLVLALPAPLRARMGMACSCFVSLPEPGDTGPMLVGRNLDYYLEGGLLGADGIVTRTMKEQVVCFIARPLRTQPYLSIAWPGFVGVVTGLNADGLSFSCLTSALPGQTPNGTPLPLLYRWMLERCSSLDQVDSVLKSSRRTVGNNLVVASAANADAALFEFTPRVVRRVPASNGRVLTTNHFQDSDLAATQQPWLMPNSVHRHRRLQELCTPPGMTLAKAQGALLDTTLAGGVQGEVFSFLSNPGTIYGIVVDPAARRCWLRANDRPERAFVEIDVAEAWRTSVPAASAVLV
jgi:isopenicillin-N N-acyltransferase-like protein